MSGTIISSPPKDRGNGVKVYELVLNVTGPTTVEELVEYLIESFPNNAWVSLKDDGYGSSSVEMDYLLEVTVQSYG